MDLNKIRQGVHFKPLGICDTPALVKMVEGIKLTFDVSAVHHVARLPVSVLGSDFKYPLTFLSYNSLERRGQNSGLLENDSLQSI